MRESKLAKVRLKILPSPKRDVGNSSTNIIGPALAGAIIGHIVAPGIGGIVAGGLLGGVIGESDEKEKKMTKMPVFYSFHFDNDVMRVQQVRNIGAIEGNTPTTPNEWEKLKRTGNKAVENWIEKNMKYKKCVIVLIGTDTWNRPWIKYEIEKAWNDGRALLGIYIHNLSCPRNGKCRKGKNPFDEFSFNDERKLSTVIPCYDPSATNAYQDISNNISRWINNAITNKPN